MDDLRFVATRLWVLLGQRPAPRSDWARALSDERIRWFKPSEAERVVELLVQDGLLVPGPSSSTWAAAPGLSDVAVPIAYRPPADLLAIASAARRVPLFDRILREVVRSAPAEEGAAREEAARLAKELDVVPEAAALLVAWRRGLSLPEMRVELDQGLRASPAPAGRSP